ncbi:polyamine aminopropyltransferase [bacterium]|nr:polyamine aminopropyltransferase [bacterium]
MSDIVHTEDAGKLTFTEWDVSGIGISWRLDHPIEHITTPYQTIDLYETDGFGKLLVHDGAVMLTERDEHAYHEMLVHVPLFSHPNPKRVLVIGGGDGGTLREIVKHSSVELARQVEIDEEVVNIARNHMPQLAVAFDHPKVDLIIGDGIKAVEDAEPGSYDIILVDSTDPIGPAVQLFEAPFYRNVHRALTADGIVACQIASPILHLEQVKKVVTTLRGIFDSVEPFIVKIPAYPSGNWAFAMSRKNSKLRVEPDAANAEAIEAESQYWNRAIHKAAFALPQRVKRALESN